MIATGSDARQTRSFCPGLTDFLLQSFAAVTHAFVLVRIRRTQRAHFRRDLTYPLAVDAGEHDLGLLGIHTSFDAGGQRILDGVGVAEVKHDHSFTLHLGAVADADNVEFARPAAGDAFHRVVDQSARQAMHRSLRIVLADGDDVAIFLFDLDAGREGRIQLALL